MLNATGVLPAITSPVISASIKYWYDSASTESSTNHDWNKSVEIGPHILSGKKQFEKPNPANKPPIPESACWQTSPAYQPRAREPSAFVIPTPAI